jgi:hypothetical protein
MVNEKTAWYSCGSIKMTEESKKGHLYAIKMMSILVTIGFAFVSILMYNPIYLIWIIGGFFGILIFTMIYSVFYDIGKDK